MHKDLTEPHRKESKRKMNIKFGLELPGMNQRWECVVSSDESNAPEVCLNSNNERKINSWHLATYDPLEKKLSYTPVEHLILLSGERGRRDVVFLRFSSKMIFTNPHMAHT